MAQFEFVAWLVKWILEQESFEFDWDHGNSTKSLQKHKISSDSAEQAFMNRDLLVPLGIQVAPVDRFRRSEPPNFMKRIHSISSIGAT